MKTIYIFLAASLLLGVVSCGDNTDFSTLHKLTQDEIDEIARQDSIKEAQKNRINADLILEYTANITISKTLYDGTSLEIEIDKIAELFGITNEELLAGIAGESGAPEVKGFAIEWSTRADNASATNTNAPWGHWWDKNGDITVWGTDAMVFAEFDTETGIFNIGQYPDHLTPGQTFKFIECLKYNEKRVAVVVTVVAQSGGEVTAQVVNTQELSIELTPKADYTTVPLDFDWELTKKNLGISSIDEMKFIAVNEDGSYAQESNGGDNGYWYDMNGYASVWGDNSSVFTSFDEGEDGGYTIGIGQYPGHIVEGNTFTIKYGFLANNKIEMLKITIMVVGYEDQETPPVGTPTKVEKDITLTKAWSNDYASIQEDLKETLREAFKMTTYQIHNAIITSDLKVYIGEVTEGEPAYTADVPGYWIKADGTGGGWAEGLIWCSIGHNETELYLYGGNHPENSVVGDTVLSKMIITCNGGEVVLNITFKLTQELI